MEITISHSQALPAMPAGCAVSSECYKFHFWKINSTCVLRIKKKFKFQKLPQIVKELFKKFSFGAETFCPSSVGCFCGSREDPACSCGEHEESPVQLCLCCSFPFPFPLLNLATLAPAEAVKEDGKPSYCRMITIINIHGWFTYHS